MESYAGSFDWVPLPAGRARFAGGIRGIDEVGHETFAADVGGREYFGEIQRAFLPNDNDYNIEVVSFGYGDQKAVGMPMPGTCEVFTLAEVGLVEALAAQLIAAGTRFAERPTLLVEYPNAHFMGEVLFRDGWILARDERAVS